MAVRKIDLIDRQAAIDAIESLVWYHQNRNKDMVSGANSHLHQPWYKSQDVYDALEKLPYVQSEQELLKDGTLVVKTDFDMTKFDRVNVIQNGTHYGDLFYQDDDTRRKGKWIIDNPHSDMYRYTCSKCKAQHRARYDLARYNFCPNCGADMREGDSDEN